MYIQWIFIIVFEFQSWIDDYCAERKSNVIHLTYTQEIPKPNFQEDSIKMYLKHAPSTSEPTCKLLYFHIKLNERLATLLIPIEAIARMGEKKSFSNKERILSLQSLM